MKNMNIRYFQNNILQCIRFSREQKRFSQVGCVFHGLKLFGNTLEIPFVEYAVTMRCTLRCKYCSNLVPYFHTPEEITLEQAKQEITQLLKQVDYIYRFKVHGGEPFLYSMLSELLEWLCIQDKIGEVRISTNGTVIPSPKILKQLENPKIIVFVSGYPEYIAPQRKQIIGLLGEKGVRVRNLEEQVWCDTGNVEQRCRSTLECEKIVKSCSMANCKALTKGYFYQCSRCANGDLLGLFQEKERVKIEESKKVVRKSLRKMYELKSCTGCMYCDGVGIKGPFIPPAEQMEERYYEEICAKRSF